MPDDKLKIFKEALTDALKIVKESMNKEEFLNAFKEVLKAVAAVEAKLIQKINDKLSKADEEIAKISDKIDAKLSDADMEIELAKEAAQQAQLDLQTIVQETRDANSTTLSSLKKRGIEAMDALFAKMRLRDRFDALIGEYADKVDEMNDRIAEIPTKEEFVALIPKQVEETPEQTRDKLESLKGDERLSSSAIKGLEDEIKALRKEIATKTSGGVRRVFQPYVDDFSSQTNGSLKVFALSREPLKTETVLVWGTDFPIILRPTTDFTIVGKTLTLTSAVPAPNTGATLLVRYDA